MLLRWLAASFLVDFQFLYRYKIREPGSLDKPILGAICLQAHPQMGVNDAMWKFLTATSGASSPNSNNSRAFTSVVAVRPSAGYCSKNPDLTRLCLHQSEYRYSAESPPYASHHPVVKLLHQGMLVRIDRQHGEAVNSLALVRPPA